MIKNFDTFYRQLRSYEDNDAIIENNITYTYRDVVGQIELFENIVRKDIEQPSLISVYADASFKSVCLFLCLCKMGHTVVPISEVSKNKKEEFQKISQADYEICFDKTKILINKLNNTLQKHKLYEDIKKRKSCGLVIFSSGSTGKNKAALHDLNFLFEKFLIKRRKRRVICFYLFDHIGGIDTFLYTLSSGGCLIIPKEKSAKSVLSSIQDFKAELLPASPSFINILLMSGEIYKHDVSSLKIISYGTEIMHKNTLKKIKEVIPEIKLIQTYGLTEVGILKSKSLSDESLWVKLGGDHYETRVVDGKLQIKGKSAMLGYLNAPNPFTEDGWVVTNDNVQVNGQYYKILGRDSDIINIGGQKVHPSEIENVILEIDEVFDVSVFAESNIILGNIVCANILTTGNENDKKLKKKIKEYCSLRMEKYKVPIKIIITKEIQNNRFKRIRKNIKKGKQ